MKKIALFYFFTGMLLLMFVSCSSLVKIIYDNGTYVDKANGITYYAAGVSYEPKAVGKEYAEYKKTVLYEIDGLDPKLWLTEAYEGIGSIYYSSEITLPTFLEFEPQSYLICQVSNTIENLKTVTNESDIESILDAYANGDDVEMPTSGESYHLKFTSEKYPGIYYDLVYVQNTDADDKCYLYDRNTKRCVEIGNVVSKYFGGSSDET